MKEPRPKADDAVQSARFIETAKALEVDETGQVFKRAFEKIVPEKKRVTGPERS